MSALATITDVEAVSSPVPTEDQARVNRLIDMVSMSVVRYTGQRFEEETETIVAWPNDGVLRLPQWPVTAIASVAMAGAALASTMYTFTVNGYVNRTPVFTEWSIVNGYDPSYLLDYGYGYGYGYGWPGPCRWPYTPFTIDYTHGYPDGESPDDVAMVVAEVVAGKWLAGASQASGLTSESIDGYAQGWELPRHPEAWSPAHRQILDAYRRSGLTSLRLT